MSPQTFAASFPDWRVLEALRDPAFLSDFWRRTALQARSLGRQRAADSIAACLNKMSTSSTNSSHPSPIVFLFVLVRATGRGQT